MNKKINVNWQGVYPATTTQFNQDESVNYDSTQQVVDNLINDGVDGIVALGTVGENCSLRPNEKRQLISCVKEVVNGRVPLIAGTAECTTQLANEYIKDMADIGVDGVMLLPSMVYQSNERETCHHFQYLANENPDMPIMVYNNPVSYGVDVSISMMRMLAEHQNIVAIKESAADTRRITELLNTFNDRFQVFIGVDDIALESLMLGAVGWVSGLTNAFPKESVALFTLAKQGRFAEARAIYRWFLPLLRLDTVPTLVQCIKLAEQICGRGSEMVRTPRLPLAGEERHDVVERVEQAIATRPDLSKYSIEDKF